MEVEGGAAHLSEELEPLTDNSLTPWLEVVEEVIVQMDREVVEVELSFLRSRGHCRMMEKSVPMEQREKTLLEEAVVDP